MLVNLGNAVDEEKNQNMQSVDHWQSVVEDIEIILKGIECDGTVVLPVEQVSLK